MKRAERDRHEMMRRKSQRYLRGLLNDLEALAEEAAAAPGADKARRDLPEAVGQLRCAVTQVESKMKPSGAYDLHQALLMAVTSPASCRTTRPCRRSWRSCAKSWTRR
jgi:hypothetical protein